MSNEPEETVRVELPAWLRSGDEPTVNEPVEDAAVLGESWRDLPDDERGETHFRMWAEETGWVEGDPDPLPDTVEPDSVEVVPHPVNSVNLKPVFGLIVAMYVCVFMVFWGSSPIIWFISALGFFCAAVIRLYGPLRDAAVDEAGSDGGE